MTYNIDFQFMPRGAERPSDDGQLLVVRREDSESNLVLPAIGDHAIVEVDGQGFRGRVRSRLFTYIGLADNRHCHINIVLEEVPEPGWAALMKE